MSKRFTQIIELEEKLHSSTNRQNMVFLNRVLHDDFFEFCRSGVETNKMDTLASLMDETEKQIYGENYVCTLLNENCILMTYISFEQENQIKTKQTNRSSIWLKNSNNEWQLRFHQGTPQAR